MLWRSRRLVELGDELLGNEDDDECKREGEQEPSFCAWVLIRSLEIAQRYLPNECKF
jgi:hypothetical protein